MIVRAEGVQEKNNWVQMAGNTANDYLWKYLDYSYFRRNVEYKSESERGENDSVARDNYQPNC